MLEFWNAVSRLVVDEKIDERIFRVHVEMQEKMYLTAVTQKFQTKYKLFSILY